MSEPVITPPATLWLGRSAALIGAFLCWYAVWTVTCTTLVLAGGHYRWLLWAPLPPTLAMVAYLRRWGDVVGHYARLSAAARVASFAARDWMLLTGAAAACFIAADIGHRIEATIPLISACAIAAGVAWVLDRRCRLPARDEPETRARQVGWQLLLFAAGLFAFYYLAHKPDADDANFVNLAVGAKRTAGAVYQYDTMLGDGRSAIHLPTYKFHSFELLAAVVSSYTGLSALAVSHAVLPALLLIVLTAVIFAILYPALRGYWLAGAIVWAAFLLLNSGTLATWGAHGVPRFFQGKGFYITALLPLIAAVTARWMRHGHKVDLLALTAAQICAVGFSANGLYGGPAASGLVALAYVLGAPGAAATWRRALLLLPTLTWQMLAAGAIVLFHLALPSEVTEPTTAINQLNFVTQFGVTGRLILMMLALSPIGLSRIGLGRAGLVYVPAAMIVMLNPASWAVIAALTGNLGFRIFWSVPLPLMAAVTVIALLRATGRASFRTATLVACALFAAALVSNLWSGAYAIGWRAPDLKVDRTDYDTATALARNAPAGCAVLAPERYSALLSLMEDAPYPVFVRKLYLMHYRFTLPPAERALRDRLRRIVDGGGAAMPSQRELATADIRIGAVAVERGATVHAAAARFARELKLNTYRRIDGLDVWSGSCGRRVDIGRRLHER